MVKIAISEVLVTDGNLSLFLPIPLQKGKWGGKRKGWGMDAVGGATPWAPQAKNPHISSLAL